MWYRQTLYFFIGVGLAVLLFFAPACVSRIQNNRGIINEIMQYYPGYEIEVLTSDPNTEEILIRIRKEG